MMRPALLSRQSLEKSGTFALHPMAAERPALLDGRPPFPSGDAYDLGHIRVIDDVV